jgi:hypothetical protein
MPGAQAAGLRRRKVGAMRRNHHAGFGRQIEGLGRSEIDARFRFIIAGELGAQDCVEEKSVAAGKIDQKGDIAV